MPPSHRRSTRRRQIFSPRKPFLAITIMDAISAQSRNRLRQTVIDEIKTLEESTRALKSRRNELAPISRLPPETLGTIFTFLSASAWNERPVNLEWIRVAHVCRRWRDAALNHPRFWSYINFTKLTSAGMAEILARAKMAPLHLEADVSRWMPAQTKAFEGLLEAHISHIRHLSISGYLENPLARLSLSAPILESLSLSHIYLGFPIPDNLFNCTAPNLTSLELEKCDISWKSPLLKGLRNLRILDISTKASPKLEACPLISEHSRTITLPSLTHFHIDAFAKNCAFALAHLVLPNLTRLHIDVKSHDKEGEDVRLAIPYVARNVDVLQDIKPIRSILIAGERTCAEVYAWAMPDADVKICDPETLGHMSRSACLLFTAKGDKWRNGVDSAIFDALFTHLSVDSVLTVTTQNRTRLSKEFCVRHAPRWPLLEQARLVPTSVGAFLEMLAEDTPPDGPRLPSLTRLIVLHVRLTSLRMYHLGDMLIKRVEQGVPLEVLDLRTCVAADRAIRSFSEIVVDVQEPVDAPPMTMEEFFKDVGIGYRDRVEYDDGRSPCEDEDEDEDEGEPDDEFIDEELMYQLWDDNNW
ncbi:hypothetical protein BGY98DRAFT_959374 [Russula aff. rugulosa BPL654]|nr:hypothetical protein BGY98DRAFT_959374 [Russula aff. rugulosa BPL654]